MSTTAKERLRLALKEHGVSQRAAERTAGLHNGHLSVILGRNGNMTVETAEKLALALDVSAAWLLTGQGDMHEAPASTAKPLPAQPFAPMPLDAALDAAFDQLRHKVSDAITVRQILSMGLALTRPAEAHALAGAMLDAAAWLREHGAQVTREALLEALALRVVELRATRAAG